MLFNFNNNGGDMNALEMALEALTNPSTIAVSHAIDLIRYELAKSKQNKPLRLSPMYEYGHIHDASQPEQKSISTNDHLYAMLRQVHDVLACTALPMKRPWVGLTDEEILSAAKKVPITCIRQRDYDLHFAPIIEAKLREKNGG